MIEAEPPLGPSVFHRVFYGPSELRAGWRLLIFLAIVIAVINTRNLTVRRLLHGADDTTLFFLLSFIKTSYTCNINDLGITSVGDISLKFWS